MRQLLGPQVRTWAWWSRRSSRATTAAVSPRSLPQSSTGRFDVISVDGSFIATHHDLQEVLGRGVGQPPHPEVVNEEQRDGGDLRDVLLAGAGELRIGEFLEEDVGLPVEDAMALLDHGEADRLGQVALAGAGRPMKQAVLVLGDEAAGGELKDQPAIHLLVEVEVERVEGLAAIAEAGLRDAALEEPVLAAQELVLDERGEEVDGGQRARSGPRAAAARARRPCRSSGAGAGRVAARRGSCRELLLGLARDHVAVVGEVTDERIDLAEREGHRRVPLEVAPHEAVVGDLQLQRRGAGVVDGGGAVFLDQGEDPEEAAHAGLPVPAMEGLAERADVGPGAGGLREQRQRGGRGARRPIRGVDRVAPRRLAAVLPQERARGGMEEADVHAVPLDRDVAAEPARRRGVVGVLDLDAAVEMDRARPNW